MSPTRNVRDKILMGPGPSTVSTRVLRAISEPTMGHLDPDFLEIMSQNMDLLRMVFETENQLTMPMSGTGSAGMETAFVNLVEPGDKVLICVKGLFGQRMADVAERCGAEVIQVQAPWGRPIDPAEVKLALDTNPGIKVLGIVYAETSTGVLQPLEEISKLCKEYDVLMIVDAVTAIGGVSIPTDRLGLDFIYSGTQKCLSCPPGLAPITVSYKAAKAIANRKTKVQSWYLDLSMIQRYWGQERFYHHTAPINMIYALHEALTIIKEEGLEARFARHHLNQSALVAGLEAMGLQLPVPAECRLVPLTLVSIPEGIADLPVRQRLLKDFNIEIGGGLGEFKGKAWRIGLMGSASTKANVLSLLTALGEVFCSLGNPLDVAASLGAAYQVYAGNEAKASTISKAI